MENELEELRTLKALQDRTFGNDAAKNATLRANLRTTASNTGGKAVLAKRNTDDKLVKVRQASIFEKSRQRYKRGHVLPDPVASTISAQPPPTRKRRRRDHEIPLVDLTTAPDETVSSREISFVEKQTVKLQKNNKNGRLERVKETPLKRESHYTPLDALAAMYSSSTDSESSC